MRDGGRLAAAIEVLTEIETRHKPVRLALKAWGDASRYAGAKDRAWVSGLVLDVLRRKRSLGWRMGEETARATALAALRFAWDWTVDRVAEAAGEEPHGPGPLTDAERAALTDPRELADAPPAVRGDYPDWLDATLARVYGDDRAEEGAALAQRAPVDLRVNTLKTDPVRALKALEPFAPQAPGLSPNALRIPAPEAAARSGAVEAIPQFGKGWFEVQDLGSQAAALAAGDVKGKQVLDLCAGGGGKTLALAAAMANTGQIYAYDSDARRLADTVRRGERAGVRNLQVRTPLAKDPLHGLDGRMDVVFIDAPCTGTGSWRRHPDTKWRLTPEALERRQKDQDQVLDDGARFTKPGGRLVYVTCSVLPDEDEDRVEAFLARHGDFARRPAAATAELKPFLTPAGDLRLTPRTSNTDGFYVAVLEKLK
jgi:16S rRNA (cytosine967-C5)-methyltransferase